MAVKKYTEYIQMGKLNLDDPSNIFSDGTQKINYFHYNLYLGNAKESKGYVNPQWRYLLPESNTLTVNERADLFTINTSEKSIKLKTIDSGSDNQPNSTPLLNFLFPVQYNFYSSIWTDENAGGYYSGYASVPKIKFSVKVPDHDSIISVFSANSMKVFTANTTPDSSKFYLRSLIIYFKNGLFYLLIDQYCYNNGETTYPTVIAKISDSVEQIGEYVKFEISYDCDAYLGFNKPSIYPFSDSTPLQVIFNDEIVLKVKINESNSNAILSSIKSYDKNHNEIIYKSINGNVNNNAVKYSNDEYGVLFYLGSGNNGLFAKPGYITNRSTIDYTADVKNYNDSFFETAIVSIKNPLPEQTLNLTFNNNIGDELEFKDISTYLTANIYRDFDLDLLDISTKVELDKVEIDIPSSIDIAEDITPVDILNPISIQVKEDIEQDILKPITIDIPGDIILDILNPTSISIPAEFENGLLNPITIDVAEDITPVDILNPISIQVKEDIEQDILKPITISIPQELTPVDLLNPISIQIKEDVWQDALSPITISVPQELTPVDLFQISLEAISPFKPLEEVEEYINKTYLGSQQAAEDFQLLMKITDTSYWPVEYTIDNEYHIHIKPDPMYIGVELYACTNKQFLYCKYDLMNIYN